MLLDIYWYRIAKYGAMNIRLVTPMLCNVTYCTKKTPPNYRNANCDEILTQTSGRKATVNAILATS